MTFNPFNRRAFYSQVHPPFNDLYLFITISGAWCRWVLLACLTLCYQGVFAQVALDTPIGGWRNSSGESSEFVQDTQYPASRVQARTSRLGGDQRIAMIRGRIKGQSKPDGQRRQPGLLVINGVSMPIETDEAGNFARPYVFGPGANNVEVRSSDRTSTKRVTFYDSNAARKHIGLRVVLSWDTAMTDLDMHVISPDGEHVWYGQRVAKNGGSLDQDVTGGYGPEIFAIPSPVTGNWHVYVNYFGGYGANADEKAITVAKVSIIRQEGTVDEKREEFQIPMRKPGELTLVKSFNYP